MRIFEFFEDDTEEDFEDEAWAPFSSPYTSNVLPDGTLVTDVHKIWEEITNRIGLNNFFSDEGYCAVVSCVLWYKVFRKPGWKVTAVQFPYLGTDHVMIYGHDVFVDGTPDQFDNKGQRLAIWNDTFPTGDRRENLTPEMIKRYLWDYKRAVKANRKRGD